MALFVLRETKSVAADHRIVVNYDSFADDRVFADRDARVNLGLIADRHVVIDRRVRMNPNALSQFDVFAYD